MMAATLAERRRSSRIAREPKWSISPCLEAIGAKIQGAGSGVIRIEGVERLHGAPQVMPDRIETGTYRRRFRGNKVRLGTRGRHRRF